jgi:hypothetical protein
MEIGRNDFSRRISVLHEKRNRVSCANSRSLFLPIELRVCASGGGMSSDPIHPAL